MFYGPGAVRGAWGRGGEGGGIDWGRDTPKRLYKAPKRLYKAPKDYTKPQNPKTPKPQRYELFVNLDFLVTHHTLSSILKPYKDEIFDMQIIVIEK